MPADCLKYNIQALKSIAYLVFCNKQAALIFKYAAYKTILLSLLLVIKPQMILSKLLCRLPV